MHNAGPRLGFIYVSGTWVHGSSLKDRLNDLNPVNVQGDPGCPVQAASFVAWRPALEQAVVDTNSILDAVVVRPALVYGRGCAVWSSWFGALQKAASEKRSSVELQCTTGAIASLIHVDEVATGTVAATEQLSRIASSSAWPIFDLTTSREPLQSILQAAARSFGFEGELGFVKPSNPIAEALCTSARLESTRARDLLGWQSKRMFGMLDEIEILVAAWQASSRPSAEHS